MSNEKDRKIFMGVDLGFIQTKATALVPSKKQEKPSTPWETKFGSLVKPRSEVATALPEDAEGDVITYKGMTYNVGAKGALDFKAERGTRDTDIVKLLNVFGRFQRFDNIARIHTVVSGLPVYEYNLYREELAEAILKSFTYEYNGYKKFTMVKNVDIIPQSAGAFYDVILDDEGELRDVPYAFETVLVLDIGGRTTDGCIMEASKYSQDSFTIFEGVWKTQNELRRLIMKEFHYNMKPHEVDDVMRSGLLKIGGRTEDVSFLVEKAVATAYPTIRDELSLYAEDFRRFSAVILVGGGSLLYERHLKEDINTKVITHDHPEFANARGYLKYGLFKAKA